jgi:hypothetical protein
MTCLDGGPRNQPETVPRRSVVRLCCPRPYYHAPDTCKSSGKAGRLSSE